MGVSLLIFSHWWARHPKQPKRDLGYGEQEDWKGDEKGREGVLGEAEGAGGVGLLLVNHFGARAHIAYTYWTNEMFPVGQQK